MQNKSASLLKEYKMDSLDNLTSQIANCKKCTLHKTRKNTVCGAGNHKSTLMLAGEAPGANEDLAGTPFCGKAGNVLDEILKSAGFNRRYIYITNILKCRPPGNRNPREDEIKACTPYLDQQIKLIRPRVIGCLGNFATAYMLKKFNLSGNAPGISKIHGKIFNDDSLFDNLKIVPLYHPAVATYNANMITVLKRDFANLKMLLY